MVTYDFDSTKPENTVLRQSVKAGEMVKRGTAVILTLNAKQKVVKIPDIIGLDSEEADKIVTAAGFNLLIYADGDHPYTTGKIYSQGPKPGLYAESGSDIVVLIDGGEEYTGPPVLNISDTNVSINAGEEFTLEIDAKGIEALSLISYEISEPKIAEVVFVDKKTLAMTFRGLSAGTTEITLSCKELKQVCTVSVR